MNQNKPFYVVLVVATCIVMVLSGLVLNFALGLRSEIKMVKANIVNEQKYAIEQIKKTGASIDNKVKQSIDMNKVLQKSQESMAEMHEELESSIREYEKAKNAALPSVQLSENTARAFLVIWQASLEDEDNPVFVVSEKDIDPDKGVAYYHTLSRVFSPKGLIAVAKQKDPEVKTVSEAIAVSRKYFQSIVIPLY